MLLLGRTSASVQQIAHSLGLSRQRTGRIVANLESKGLVHRTPPPRERVVAVPPEVAIDQLIVRRQDELETVREAVRKLVAERAAGDGRRADELIEVVRGAETVRGTLLRIIESAHVEVLALMAPPFIMENPLEPALLGMREGVAYRAIYAEEVLGSEALTGILTAYSAAGESNRVAPTVPVKLVLVDRTVAMLPLVSPIETSDWASVLVRESGLLDALIALFDSLWHQAIPLSTAGEADGSPTAEDRRVLILLVQGLTDEAVATRLGLSRRTVVRRVHHLMGLAGARSRLQLGWLAKERGWLTKAQDDTDAGGVNA